MMLCPEHRTPMVYVAYPDENMVGERICRSCEARAPHFDTPDNELRGSTEVSPSAASEGSE